MSIEQKVEECLPAGKDSLDKDMQDATLLEHTLNGFVTAYGTIMSIFNFCHFTTLCNNDQLERMTKYHRKYDVLGLSPLTIISYACGFLGGLIDYLVIETFFYGALLSSFGFPIGMSTYLTTKALTNYLGYRHYKKQREKHLLLEQYKKPLIEEKK